MMLLLFAVPWGTVSNMFSGSVEEKLTFGRLYNKIYAGFGNAKTEDKI